MLCEDLDVYCGYAMSIMLCQMNVQYGRQNTYINHKQPRFCVRVILRRVHYSQHPIRRLLRCLAEPFCVCVRGCETAKSTKRSGTTTQPQRFGPRQEVAHWKELRSGA